MLRKFLLLPIFFLFIFINNKYISEEFNFEGEEIEIGFNAKYLQEISNQVESGEAIFLFNDVGDPALMKDNNDDTAVYVVMPMRV